MLKLFRIVYSIHAKQGFASLATYLAVQMSGLDAGITPFLLRQLKIKYSSTVD
ncbi:hypothetical protein [Pleurocapsa sp. FMAR1]|uniref:hypothetical protein n=1 Tax=Pleurocapsa sp. FMAR1 TaxID=3040204 RepID=UPI0029C8C7A7|nr:hypothetical protein [Pleurocapsa sp. FMAR1]